MRQGLRTRKSFFLQSSRATSKEMVHKQKRHGNRVTTNQGDISYRNSKIKIVYSNVDGLISKLMELKDIIKEKKTK